LGNQAINYIVHQLRDKKSIWHIEATIHHIDLKGDLTLIDARKGTGSSTEISAELPV
jgi:hypothetical protein